jgi:hypothetical protein
MIDLKTPSLIGKKVTYIHDYDFKPCTSVVTKESECGRYLTLDILQIHSTNRKVIRTEDVISVSN